ncbi:Bug family tripartite tricarboxylate transporter substrate binding protein [Roseococcus pinisoli]|uniref:Twin-arginine translocation pathway signal protein n=1 Tax=Roseococcus pinisoli TaxID=2835040 RepID=A0ABS5Q7T1_9PROT|nr:tripartite tricarboxylate transporter substrate-binding protein [Roseococcus pinisoli]MBS7809438.1 twin-arginine translocation pathway signal protein [Roseococcus pinisoli]
MFRRSLLATLFATPAFAQGGAAPWSPARSVRLIAPYAPGGGVDTSARLLAVPMTAALGQSVIVENRGGAGGAIGAAEVARSAPDGLTVMIDALAHTVNPTLMRGLAFDYATAFTPITQVLVWPQIMIVPASLPVRTLEEFIAYAKARPGRLTYGSSGNATAAHLAAALLTNRAGIDVTHVPYRGGAPALQDLMGGNLSFVFATVASSMQLVQDGQVRALAVSSAERLPALPNVPTVAEQGFAGYELNEWNGLYGPAGLPAPIVARWLAATKTALADPTVRARLETLGAVPVGSEPGAFAEYVRQQREAMGRIVRETGMELG